MALSVDTNTVVLFNDKFSKYRIYNIGESGATPAISKAITPTTHFRIHAIRVAAGADITTSENLTISMNMKAGASFDHVAFKKDLSTVISATELFYEYRFDPAFVYEEGDVLTLAFANTDTVALGIQLILEERY